MALATEQAPRVSTQSVVAFMRDNSPNPQNNKHDQAITTVIKGQDIGSVN